MGMRSAEIVWTDASLVEQGVADGIELDLVVGDTNDFEATVPMGCPVERGSAIAIVGTEYGGIVDDISSTTTERRRKVSGRTWLGVLASRIIRPASGQDYRTYSGDANAVIRSVIQLCDLSYLFTVPSGSVGTSVSGRFDRYTDAMSGLAKALKRGGMRLSCAWTGSKVELRAVAIETTELDALSIPVTVSDARPVNHLVCLGSGELRNRTVIDLYADAAGNVSRTQSIFGADLVEGVYEVSGADEAELLEEGAAKLEELQARSPIEVNLDGVALDLHVGDLLTVSNDATDVAATAEITRAVVRAEGGRVAASFETGSVTGRQKMGGATGGEGNGGLDIVGDITATGRITGAGVTSNGIAQLNNAKADLTSGNIDVDDPSGSNLGSARIDFFDKDGDYFGTLAPFFENGQIKLGFQARRTVNGSNYYAGIRLGLDASGNATVGLIGTGISASFRAAMAAASLGANIFTGGEQELRSTNITNGTAPSAFTIGNARLMLRDKNGSGLGWIDVVAYPTKQSTRVYNTRTVNGTAKYNGFELGLDASGNPVDAFQDAASKTAFQNALGATSLVIKRSKIVSIPANTMSLSVTADTVSGYTFLGWLQPASSDHVTAGYMQDPTLATTNLWMVGTRSSASSYRVTALYVKS